MVQELIDGYMLAWATILPAIGGEGCGGSLSCATITVELISGEPSSSELTPSHSGPVHPPCVSLYPVPSPLTQLVPALLYFAGEVQAATPNAEASEVWDQFQHCHVTQVGGSYKQLSDVRFIPGFSTDH